MIDTKGKTLQQVSDELALTLIKQGERCMNDHQCLYGNGKGQHCPVGWILPDDPKFMGFEGPLSELIGRPLDLGPNDAFIREHAEVLKLLQKLHDSPDVQVKKRICEQVSEEFELDMTAWQPWADMGVKNGTD